MNKEQAFDIIEQANVRELTDKEVDDLDTWAESTLATLEEDRARDASLSGHSLAEWITQFMKQTRWSPFFVTNFKKIKNTVFRYGVVVLENK